MAKINGSEGKIGIRRGATHGTAVAVRGGSDNVGLAFDSLEYNDSPEILEFSTKGTGWSMKNELEFGAKSPTLSITYKLKFGGVGMDMLVGFLGSQTTPAETTASQGDYASKAYYNADRKFYTIAIQNTSATAIEWASCYPVGVSLSASASQPLTVKMDFVTTPRNHSPATNTYAYLGSVDIAVNDSTSSGTWVVADQTSYWLVDETDGGSIATGDHVNFQNLSLNLTRPMELSKEVTGSATTSAPIVSGLYGGNLAMTIAGFDDHTWQTIYTAGTDKKMSIRFAGATIASGTAESFRINIPYAKLSADPVAPINSDGFNQATLNFEFLTASTSDFTYHTPYFDITNRRSAVYS
jgi:hypothetical protein